MKGVINIFKDTSGHGTIIIEDGDCYFFSYTGCTFPAENIKVGLPVQFELEYRGNDIPVAINITKED